jgi:SAM-dependent methyltransferase
LKKNARAPIPESLSEQTPDRSYPVESSVSSSLCLCASVVSSSLPFALRKTGLIPRTQAGFLLIIESREGVLMAESSRFLGLRTALALPGVYRLFTRMIGGNFNQVYVDRYVRPRPGDRVLDIGCGPGDFLTFLPQTEYHGIDVSAQYIQAARARFGSRGTFTCQGVEEAAVDRPGTYDLVLANGVLHHLDDSTAMALFRLARTALKPGGRLVTFDGCFTPRQSRVARLLLRMDRGDHVRREEEYLRLAATAFASVNAQIMHNLLRLPYTHLIMECTA